MGPINFLSINVCGLKSKLNIPEFTELINSYDIIGFQETKLDDVDEINIDGYTVICQNRKKKFKVQVGWHGNSCQKLTSKICEIWQK